MVQSQSSKPLSHTQLLLAHHFPRLTFHQTQGGLKGVPFSAFYTADKIGSYKPDLRNFDYLLDHVKQDFGAEKGQLLHVAQSLYHDHVPAKQMGLPSVWINRKGLVGVAEGEVGYGLKVGSIRELAEIVENELGT